MPRNIEQIMGHGCAFLDYNNDGNLDILLVGKQMALYAGDGHGHFQDVTHQAGLDALHGDFRGCAVGDYDGDGFDDIFLTGFHTAALLHNDHGKRFVDVTAKSGIDTRGWSTSAAWAELDNNGRLDLCVANYCQFSDSLDHMSTQLCPFDGIMSACRPNTYGPEYARLYRNNGDGTFTDVTRLWGMDRADGYALGVAFADVDGSGRRSLFVADDQAASDLFLNRGRAFTEIGRRAGVSYQEEGHGYAGMGVDWGDYDNDGRLDVFVTDYWNEKKRLLHNDGDCVFTNQFDQLHCDIGGYPRLAFGVKWLDYDNDGWLDFVYCNGHTNDNVQQMNAAMPWKQPTLLYRNNEGKSFSNVSAGLVGDALSSILGRGLAVGDFDNDGRVDILVVDDTGKPLLLHNETPGVGHWLEIKLIGTRSNRDGYGADIRATAGDLHLLRECHSDGSYESSSDSRLHVGLGPNTVVSDLSVTWPSGRVDRFSNVQADRVITIKEGQGVAGSGQPAGQAQ